MARAKPARGRKPTKAAPKRPAKAKAAPKKKAKRQARTAKAPPPPVPGAILGVASRPELPPSDFPGITDRKKRAYLAAFSATGKLDEAAAAAEVTLKTGYNWRHNPNDPAFAEAFEQAQRMACDLVEAEIRRRAMEGVVEPVYQGGRMVGTVRKFSDTLLIFLAKGLMPERYRERFEHSGTLTGIPPLVVRVSDGDGD